MAAHASAEELEAQYRAASDPVERSQRQIVWLLASGRSRAGVAAATGYSPRRVSPVLARYNAAGPAGLGDRRHANAGGPPLLDGQARAALDVALEAPPPDGGLGTGRKVAAWIAERTGRAHVAPQRGWDYLVRTDPSRRMPRPRHAQSADPAAAAAFQKNLNDTVDEERAREPGRPVELWAFDEHRAGLKPVLRRVWTKRGRRPAALSRPRYEWLYLYGFVRPLSGLVEWFVGSTVDVDLFSEILASFARAVGAGPRKLVLLVLDGAGWHVSAGLRVPDGLRLVFLPLGASSKRLAAALPKEAREPAYSPELQPAEHLWPLAREGIANRHFATLAELEAKITDRCRTLRDDPAAIKANTLFHGWPKTA